MFLTHPVEFLLATFEVDRDPSDAIQRFSSVGDTAAPPRPGASEAGGAVVLLSDCRRGSRRRRGRNQSWTRRGDAAAGDADRRGGRGRRVAAARRSAGCRRNTLPRRLALLTVEVALVALTSSLSLAVAAVAKELVLVAVAALSLGDEVLPRTLVGFGLTASGVLAYNLQRLLRRREDGGYGRVPAEGEEAAEPPEAELQRAPPPLPVV